MNKRTGRTTQIISLLMIILSLTLMVGCGDSQNKGSGDTEKKSDPAADYVLAQKLAGNWLRSDGPYRLHISAINKDGSLRAQYFNPGPINVSISNWQTEGGLLKLFVELRDTNYPGSTYTLYYNSDENILEGEYFQAVQKDIFVVDFVKE